MTNFPERIAISPVYRQKRPDDFYLVDQDAFPGKGVEYVRADRIEELQARAEAAEAKLAKARNEALDEAAELCVQMTGTPRYGRNIRAMMEDDNT